MMNESRIAFLRSSLPPVEAYLTALQEMQERGHYSNFGPLNQRFEERIRTSLFAGSGHLTTVSNCTLGLVLAISALKRPGARYALMPSFTFAATPLAAQWCGLEPYFVDIDSSQWSLDQHVLLEALDRLGDQVAVVIPYATFGQPIELGFYRRLVESGIPVVVDAAPGLGAASPSGIPFGVDFPGAIVFSCHATKPFGIGEGGVVYSGNPDLVERVRRDSNFAFDERRLSVGLGINAKLPEAMAAVGLAVAESYPGKLARLEALHSAYVARLEEVGLLKRGWCLQRSKGRVPWQFLPLLAPGGIEPDSVMRHLAELGIETRAYFRPPCHAQPQFSTCATGSLAVTEWVAGRIVCLPLWDGMEETAVDRVVSGLADFAHT